MKALVDAIIRRAQRTPYFHLQHADGSLYMERFWLRSPSNRRDRWAVRVHHIVTEDLDRELHDHPWDFVSVILRGGYVEARPFGTEPDFGAPDGGERVQLIERKAGSIAFRRATDRHRIVFVLPDTWTLFITSPKRQWWGFYTQAGKVHWRAFESVQNTTAITGQPS